MSSLRGCDRCGGVFSENEEDWSTFTGKRVRRDKVTGRKYTEEVDQDACPECSIGQPPRKDRPRLPFTLFGPPPPAAPADEHEAHIKELETSELLARVQALEAASLATTRPDSQ